MFQRLASFFSRPASASGSTARQRRRSSASGGSIDEHGGNAKTISKCGSLARSIKATSVQCNLGYFEGLLERAVRRYVCAKDKEGAVKHTHGMASFWLTFGKLEEGFNTLQGSLEELTGSRLGPLPTEKLLTHAQTFGIAPESATLQEIVYAAPRQRFEEMDFVGLLTALLAIHLIEPGNMEAMHPSVRTMLNCLEQAFTHFESARKGRLSRDEVEAALLEDSAHKAHTKDGKHTAKRTGTRVAARLFESIEWDSNHTISFETYLRGIVTMVSEEYGDLDE